MTPERWQQISRLYHAVVHCDVDQRAELLDQACAGDAALRRELESLLSAGAEIDGPLLGRSVLSKLGVGDRSDSESGGTVVLALAAGTHVGPYEIRSLLGRGGMGEVYRATDTRLRREVAIKLLRGASVDPGRLDRFEREARAAAALNHPNIVTTYDVGSSHAGPYVVSELLEGETLRERIAGGAGLPLRTVIDYGQQIAHGLAAAHVRGIVHRDLKPENVFVTRAGQLKILDFGLAKLTQPIGIDTGAPGNLDDVATLPGFVLGTPGYMAPEQAVGGAADHRADIFSFGVVLYELATGSRAFHGKTRGDTMAALLKDEPAGIAAIRQTSATLSRIVTRCIDKVPERRFQSAADLAFALEGLSQASDVVERPRPLATLVPASRRRTMVGVVGILLAVISLLAIKFAPAGRPGSASDTAVRQSAVVAPPGHAFGSDPTQGDVPFSLSPDGGSMAFVARAGDETAVWIWIRALGALDARKLSGTEGAIGTPFWSPDGSSVAYFVKSTLKAVELATGTTRTICELGLAGADSEGTWGAEAMVAITPPLLSVCPVAGGRRSPLLLSFESSRRPAAGSVSRPQFLPDGIQFIFTMQAPSIDHNGVFVSSLTAGSRMTLARRLLPDQSVAAYAAGQLLFIRDGVLMAQPFEPKTATLSGAARSVTQSVEFIDALAARLAASASTVSYVTGTPRLSEFMWVTAAETRRAGVPAADYESFSLSHDGTRLAVVRRDRPRRTAELWVTHLASGASRAASTTLMTGGIPVWSADDRQIAFIRFVSGRSSITLVPVGGGSERELLVETAEFPTDSPPLRLHDWVGSPGLLTYHDLAGKLFVLSASREAAQPQSVETISRVFGSQFSPDGRMIAYASLDGVYVEPWPATGQRWRVSQQDDGVEPRWGAKGPQLYYRTFQGQIVMADFTGREMGAADAPRVVRDEKLRGARTASTYAVAPDGRLLVKKPVDDERAIVTVSNWTTMLERR